MGLFDWNAEYDVLAPANFVSCNPQGDHLSGKPGNVSCQGKNLVREKLPKTVYCKLRICVNTGI